jgi:flagellar motor switch/type III secretory pathway protein FliN
VLQRVGSIAVPVSVQLCRRKMTLGELSALGPGSFIPFSTKCDQPLELRVDRATIAEGEAVRFGSQLGWRLSHFVDEKSSL